MSQFPTKLFLQEQEEKWDDDKHSLGKAVEAACGQLFKMNYYRIVLDEAHLIKNKDSLRKSLHIARIRQAITDPRFLGSIACSELLGKYKWAISASPLGNTPAGM